MMKNVLYALCVFLTASAVLAQEEGRLCVVMDDVQHAEDFNKELLVIEECPVRYVKLNFHFVLDAECNGNFNEVDDGFGGPSGYDVAQEVVDAMNAKAANNIQLSIPPGNSIPIEDVNVQFLLNAVYFICDQSLYEQDGQFMNTDALSQQAPDAYNIFYGTDWNAFPDGQASIQGSAQTFFGSTSIKGAYQRYLNWLIDGVGQRSWWMHSLWKLTYHELGHLLGLDHTVLEDDGAMCSLTDPNCGDHCDDTPSAFEMNNLGYDHPACNWEWPPVSTHCSNNLMDYSGYHALSPCQIERIHLRLQNSGRELTLCSSVIDNVQFCSFSYPQIAYYGDDILVGDCVSGTAFVEENERVDVHFFSEVDLVDFEVENGAQFEILGSCYQCEE